MLYIKGPIRGGDLVPIGKNQKIIVTNEYIRSLKATMKAQCNMYREHCPHLPNEWIWGRCYIENLNEAPDVEIGGLQDYPTDGLGDFAVLLLERAKVIE